MNLGLGLGINANAGTFARFTPSDAANLDFWIKADEGVTFDGSDNVSAWTDQSSSGFDMAQGSGAAQPTYVASSQNGLPGVDFDGSAHFMTKTETDALADSTGTLFAVVSGVGASLTNSILSVSKSDDAGQDDYSYLGIRTDRLLDFTTRVTGTNSVLTGGTTLSGAKIMMISSNGSTTTSEVDGISETLGVTAGSNDGSWLGFTPNTNNLTVGALRRLTDIFFFNGVIHEIVYYGAEKTTAEKAQVNSYLKSKWGI